MLGYLDYKGAPSDGSAWITNCHQKKFFFGIIVFADYIIHRGGNYGSDRDWSRIFVRGHAGKSNPSSLGEGFRIALNLSEDKFNDNSEKLADNTKAFLKELFLTQKKFRK